MFRPFYTLHIIEVLLRVFNTSTHCIQVYICYAGFFIYSNRQDTLYMYTCVRAKKLLSLPTKEPHAAWFGRGGIKLRQACSKYFCIVNRLAFPLCSLSFTFNNNKSSNKCRKLAPIKNAVPLFCLCRFPPSLADFFFVS